MAYTCGEYCADSCDGGGGGFSCPRLQYFSSPNNYFEGNPMGSEGGGGTYGRVDAVSHMNSLAHTMANFFDAECLPIDGLCC